MGIMVYRTKSDHLKRCDLCHKASHSMYRIRLGEQNYQFCSGAHANVAAKNYKNKLDQGINPTIIPDTQMGDESNEI